MSARKNELLALADRCEREQPSRELDVDIQCYLREGEPMAEHRKGSMRAGYEPAESVWPKLTSSLDSAVTLVPEGWVEMAGRNAKGGCAEVENIAHLGNERIWTYAKTPALALCAASLRALASQGDA